jgi:hypothetical protein
MLRRAIAPFQRLAFGVRERLNVNDDLFATPLIEFGELRARCVGARFPYSVRGIRGWLSQRERRALYALARSLAGPFLEVGPWAGLSTAIIASGIRDSGVPKAFTTVELNPPLSWWRPVERGIGFFPPSSPDVPCGVSSVALYQQTIKPVAGAPGGVIGALTSNLRRLGLASYVTILEGDFTMAPQVPYAWVWVDTFHDVQEIRANAPRLTPYLTPGSILACHDTTAANEEMLRVYLPLGRSFTVDSLMVAEVM